MKYIRTKDGKLYLNLGETQNGVIIEYNYLGDGLDLDRIKLYAESYSFNNESETHLSIEWDIIREEIDIIKQTDTIEELCDEFVIIYNKSQIFKKPFTSAHDNLKDLLEEHELSKCKVYGAIWTDKGLIYVVKMNDKGDLELL